MNKEGESGESENPGTWWDKQKQEASSFSVEDCAGCRYIAGLGMYGAAVYVAYVGVQRQKLRGSKTLWGALPALVTSALLASLGTARLLRINPFSTAGHETGIDFLDRAKQRLSQANRIPQEDDKSAK